MSNGVNAAAAGASMINPLLGAGIGLIGNIAGSLIGNKANKRLWEAQNAYNHPTKQMQRLQEAGLNPALIYGSGAQTASGNASPPAKAEGPELGGIGQDIMSYQRHNLETNNLSALNDRINAQVDLDVSRALTEAEKHKLTKEQVHQLEQARDSNISILQSKATMQNHLASASWMDYMINHNLSDQQIEELSKASYKSALDKAMLGSEKLDSEKKLNRLRELQAELLQSNVDTYTANAVVRWLSTIFGVISKF